MKTQNARLYRQFHLLADKVKALVEQHKWDTLSSVVQKRIIRKLKWRYSRLRGTFSGNLLVRTLGAAAFVLGISATTQAQSFKAPVINPFNLDSLSGLNAPAIVDIDGDGDMDIFSGDYYGNINYFENTGTATSPSFAARDTVAFGLTKGKGFQVPDFADIDDDSDMDLFIGSYNSSSGNVVYLENIGTATSPAFGTPDTNAFGITPVAEYSAPSLADLDNDGDYDLLVGEEYGNRIYFENTGTASSPSFAAGVSNPFSLVPSSSGYTTAFAMADIDMDGDLDLFEVDRYTGDISYYENTGTASMASFANPTTNPFSLVGGGLTYFSVPEFADMDDDGDLDLMVGDYFGKFIYYENEGGPSGVGEFVFDETIVVYPTITQGGVTVQLNNSKAVMLTVHNPLGKTIRQLDITGRNQLELQLHEAPGIYFIHIHGEDGQQTARRVVLK